MSVRYDTIGTTYTLTRSEEPRYMERILLALKATAQSVVNVGAGTGNYEPRDREVIAVEPSATMIGRTSRGGARVIQAAPRPSHWRTPVWTLRWRCSPSHHWADPVAGLHELLRVARCRAVVLTWGRRISGLVLASPRLSERGTTVADH